MPRFSRTHSFYRRLVAAVLTLLFIAVVAQERHAPPLLGVNEGLSQGSVFDIAQDDKGFLWFATADGLNRFDGYNFELFDNDSFPLAFKRMRNLFHTKDAIWVTTTQSMIVTRIDMVTGEVRQVFDFDEHNGYGDVAPFLLSGDTLWTLVSNEGIVGISVAQGKIMAHYPEAVNSFPANHICIYDSSAHAVWYVNNRYTELYRFSFRSRTLERKVFFVPGTNDTLPLYSVVQCTDGSLRVGSKHRIMKYLPSTGTSSLFILPDVPQTGGVMCSLFPESTELTWCGSVDGCIYRVNTTTGEVEVKADPALTKSGVGHRIITFHMDHSRNLWVGADPIGLLRFDLKQKPFHHTASNPGEEGGLNSNFMKCFAQRGDEMFIGTYDHGIDVLNTRTGKYSYISGLDGVNQVVHNIVVDSLGRLWVNTEKGVGIADVGETQLRRPDIVGGYKMHLRLAKTMYLTKRGTILCGSFQGLYEILPKGNDTYELDSMPVRTNVESLCTDRDGNLWMGSSEGIFYSKGGDPHGLKLTIPKMGLVKTLHQSADGTLWAGTDRGLARVDAATFSIAKWYDEEDGMPNSFVYGILGDEEGRLWLSTNKGLTCFNPETETFRNYSVTDGLQSNEFNTNAYCKTTNGELYFGGVNGFNHFFPSEIKDNPYTPQCAVTGFKIFDKPYALDSTIEYKKQITLDYTNNNLLLEYTALEFSDAPRNRFRYRLLGLDSSWVEAADARFARFVNLDPGHYTFQVKAANSDGVWNATPAELYITITPPFWKTAGFIIAVSVISLLLIVIGVRLYFRRQLNLKTHELQLKQSARMSAIIETEEKERKRVAEELHDGLGQLLSTARLNISGIGTGLQEKDHTLWKNSLDLLDEACSEVRSISHNMMPGALIRSGLIEAIDDLVEKINAAGTLQVTFDTEVNERFPEIIEVAVFRITQEVLNNMMRHAEASRIAITLQKVSGDLQLTITDNGKSFDVNSIPESEGIGWKNIYSRVEMLNGNLNVTSEKEKGTSVYLSVPLS